MPRDNREWHLHLRPARVSALLWAGVAGRTRQASGPPWSAGSLRPWASVGTSRRGGCLVGRHTCRVGGSPPPGLPFPGGFPLQHLPVSSR